jgi:AmmeMemoRadiSam system protein B/AmmeMemoRadiSam system protein A
MKTFAAVLAVALILVPLSASAQGERPPAFAGQFYPADPESLAADIDGYLAGAGPLARLEKPIVALIVPHAGYIHSGPTAAHAYALVQGAPYETVVIIGPSHRIGFRGCSVYPRGGFKTPLGVAGVDEALAKAISDASGFGFIPAAYAEEHSVEVQVPFVQRVLPEAKIVPILMGLQTEKTIRALADGLDRACSGKKVLVVASTDLSHFLPKEEAAAVDGRTISLVREMKTDVLFRMVEAGENIMCGGGPLLAAVLYAGKRGKIGVEILARADSSRYGGPDSVVGYMAAAVVSEKKGEGGESPLTAGEKDALLRLARTAVTDFVTKGTVPDLSPEAPALRAPKGAFVTLKKNGVLRGCVGFVQATAPLYQTVTQAAVYAASEDPRFPPVRSAELEDLEIEISVLTPLREISDPRAVEVGKHGLVVERGERRGLLLPQVPVENGWGRRTFLEQACLKAGLPRDAWQKGARIFVFEALVFKD